MKAVEVKSCQGRDPAASRLLVANAAGPAGGVGAQAPAALGAGVTMRVHSRTHMHAQRYMHCTGMHADTQAHRHAQCKFSFHCQMVTPCSLLRLLC